MAGEVRKKFKMTTFTIPNNCCSIKYALKSVSGLADVGVLHGDGDGPRTPPRCMEGVRKKFQMTNFDMPNNVSSMKYALKSVSGLADVGVPQGIGDGTRAPSRGFEGVRKKFKMTNYYRPNNVSSIKHALKSVPGPADVGVLHGDGDGPRTLPSCLERSGKNLK